MRTTIAKLIVLSAVALASIAFARQGPTQAPRTVKEVMTTMTIPASDAIFSAAADPPASAEQWSAVKKSAVTLAESGRLLMTGSLAKDTAGWMDLAGQLVKEAETAAKVADARDQPALEAASDRVYATCEGCHERYMEGAK